jgi:hypothetical protein
LRWSVTSGKFSLKGMSMCISLQHCFANGHWRNRCWQVPLYFVGTGHSYNILAACFFFSGCFLYLVYLWLGARKTLCAWVGRDISIIIDRHYVPGNDPPRLYRPKPAAGSAFAQRPPLRLAGGIAVRSPLD